MAKQFKLSILFGDAPNVPPEQIAPGYEMAEVPGHLFAVPFASEGTWQQNKAKVEAYNLPPIKVASHWLDKLMVTGPDVDWELLDLWTKRMFSRLSQLGVETVGVYGVFFPVPEGFSKTKAMDQAIRYANLMADYAAPLKMRIALEPMAKLDTLWPRYLDGIAFMKEVGRSEVRVMADLAYFLKLNQPFEDIAKEPEYCLHCHIAGEKGQPGLGDRVEIHKQLFRVLRDIGYEHGVSCACPWASSDGGPFDFTKESAKTLKYLQNLRAEVYAE
jgi:sugar phosphate isomerase/epimerase